MTIGTMQYRLAAGMGIIALLALGLASLRLPEISQDCAALALMGLVLYAAFSAVYGEGRRRAFWVGVLATLLLHMGSFSQVVSSAVPSYNWADSMANYAAANYPGSGVKTLGVRNAVHTMICNGTTAVTSFVGGFIASFVYSRNQPPPPGDAKSEPDPRG